MSDATRGTTKPLAGTAFHILLALVDQERYGLDIAQEVEYRTKGQVVLGPGTLYNAIKKLLAEGLIRETAPVDRGEGREQDPRRRYYGITPEGQARLAGEARHLDLLVSVARTKNVLSSS